jgi:hypothetical protein
MYYNQSLHSFYLCFLAAFRSAGARICGIVLLPGIVGRS